MSTRSKIQPPDGYTMPGDQASGHYLHIVYRYLMADLRKHLATLEGRVVDVGCGMQPYRHLLGAKVTAYVGVDRKGPFTAPDIEGDAMSLPLPDATFDAALCTQVLEHVTDPLRVLKELSRVLRPGGTLILTCPGTWPLHECPHDFFRFTRYGLEHLLAEAGFASPCIESQGGMWASIGQLINLELSHSGTFGVRLAPLVNFFALRLEARGPKEHMALNWFVRAINQPSR
jgi:SAM-dependent methyltransferase